MVDDPPEIGESSTSVSSPIINVTSPAENTTRISPGKKTKSPSSANKRLFKSPKKIMKHRRNTGDTAVQETITMASEALSTMKNIMQNKQRDEYAIFGEKVGMKIRKLKSERVRAVVENKINNILFDAEMGKFDYYDTHLEIPHRSVNPSYSFSPSPHGTPPFSPMCNPNYSAPHTPQSPSFQAFSPSMPAFHQNSSSVTSEYSPPPSNISTTSSSQFESGIPTNSGGNDELNDYLIRVHIPGQ